MCGHYILRIGGLEVGLLWDISDVCMGLMAIINIPVLFILSRQVFRTLKDLNKKNDGDKTYFCSKDVGLKGKTDCWEEENVPSEQ